MNRFTVEQLLAVGCSKSFAEQACEYDRLSDESIVKFVRRLEGMFSREEEVNGILGTGMRENAGISNGQMQAEWDYEGDVLEYHGYTLSHPRR